jgi:hypothetical protein
MAVHLNLMNVPTNDWFHFLRRFHKSRHVARICWRTFVRVRFSHFHSKVNYWSWAPFILSISFSKCQGRPERCWAPGHISSTERWPAGNRGSSPPSPVVPQKLREMKSHGDEVYDCSLAFPLKPDGETIGITNELNRRTIIW